MAVPSLFVFICVVVAASTPLLCHASELQVSPVYLFSNAGLLGDGKQVMYQVSEVCHGGQSSQKG
jgi:hypothetical protein